MPEPILILVRCDPHRTSPNQRLHWAERNRRNQRARRAALIGWMNAGKPRVEGPVVVSVVIARGRRMDQDNVWGGLKPAMDELFNGLVTSDDGPATVTLGSVTQETGNRWKGREEVEFIIVPREEPG